MDMVKWDAFFLWQVSKTVLGFGEMDFVCYEKGVEERKKKVE